VVNLSENDIPLKYKYVQNAVLWWVEISTKNTLFIMIEY